MKRKRRNVIISSIAAVAVVGALAFLLARGCGEEEETVPAVTSTIPATTRTATTRTATSTSPEPAPEPLEPAPAPAPVPEPVPESVPLEVMDRSVAPEVSHPGEMLTFTVIVRGTADRVVVSGERTTGGGVFDFEMTPSGTSGDTTTWTYSTEATTLTGVYRYYARAFAPDGTVVEMPGVSGYTFLIEP